MRTTLLIISALAAYIAFHAWLDCGWYSLIRGVEWLWLFGACR